MTAQERELIERLRLLALKANFPSTIDDLRAAADALLSRIAEVGRLEQHAKDLLAIIYSHGLRVSPEEMKQVQEARAALSQHRKL